MMILLFTSFEINNYFSTNFSVQDVVLVMLVKPVVTLKLEPMNKDKKSNINKHLHINEECSSVFYSDCFSILDYTPTQF